MTGPAKNDMLEKIRKAEERMGEESIIIKLLISWL